MGKTNNKSNDKAEPTSNKLDDNKKVKKGKEKENIIIKKTKANHESTSKKVKTLASDHFSESANKKVIATTSLENKKLIKFHC